MKIVSITDEEILFDNGNTITFDHELDCCEHSYADFEQLDDIARATDFDPNLEFVPQSDVGFLFGNTPGKMFFVPCYSCQNGYYTRALDVYYNTGDIHKVLSMDCQFEG